MGGVKKWESGCLDLGEIQLWQDPRASERKYVRDIICRIRKRFLGEVDMRIICYDVKTRLSAGGVGGFSKETLVRISEGKLFENLSIFSGRKGEVPRGVRNGEGIAGRGVW